MYLFNTHIFVILGVDCKTIPGMLGKAYEITGRQGWDDSRKLWVKFLARPYGKKPVVDQKDQIGLKTETFITPEGQVFSFISGKSKATLRDVGRLVYHYSLDKVELNAYLEEARAVLALKKERKLEPIPE